MAALRYKRVAMQPELASQPERDVLKAGADIIRRLPLSTTFVKFLVVGGIGYLISQFALFLLYDSPVFWFLPAKDTGGDLWLFTHPDIRLLISSVLAVEVAIVFQFNSHERWTFRGRPRKGWGLLRFLKFNLTSAVSPIIVVVTVNTLTPLFGVSPYLSNTIGTGAGVTWNWILNTLVIWPQQQKVEAPDSREGEAHRAGQ
jgi:dolichol-phosphate mannosyltransferase